MKASGAAAAARRLCVALAVATATAMLATAATASLLGDPTVVSVNVGNGIIKVEKKPDRIGLFLASSSVYSWTRGVISGAKDAAKKAGVDLDVYEANFDPTAFYNAVQNAMTTKKYSAIFMQPVNTQTCKLVEREAIKQQILVVVFSTTLCGQDPELGTKLWNPGTVTYIGGLNGVEAYTRQIEDAIKDNPGKHTAIGVVGGKDFGPTKSWERTAKTVVPKYPNFTIAKVIYTDYSTPDTYKKVQDYLQGNPEVDVVITNYIDETKGVLRATKALGRKVRIYDSGYSKESVVLLRQGTIRATFPQYPYSAGRASVNALLDAAAGKNVPRYIGNDGNSNLLSFRTFKVGDLNKGFKPEW